jgi:hypothetical protein
MARTIALIRRPVQRPPAAAPAPRRGTNLRQLARGAITTLREDGVTAAAEQALAVAGVRRLVVFRRSTSIQRRDTPLPPDIAVRALTEESIDAYRALHPETSVATVRRRLHAGDLCIGAWRDDRLLSTRWLGRRRVELRYLGVSFALGPRVRYAYDAFTDVSERRHGLGVIVTDALIRSAASEGATWVVNTVLPANGRGMALARRDPPIGTLLTIRLGRRLLFVSDVPHAYLDDLRVL